MQDSMFYKINEQEQITIKQDYSDIESDSSEMMVIFGTSGDLNRNINLEIGYLLEYP
jgi:hypothetical protein